MIQNTYMRTITKPTASILLAFIGLTAQAQVRLAFNYEKGKTYVQKMDFDMDQEAGDNKTKMKMSGTYSMVVTTGNDSVKTLRVTYDRLAFVMSNNAMNFDVDTDKPVPADLTDASFMMAKIFHGMIGKNIFLKVSRRGDVLAVDSLEKFTSDVVGSLGLPEETQAAAAQGFKSQFNEASMKQSFSQAFGFLPDRVVKVGDTWTRSATLSTPITVENTYIVKEINGNEIVLESSADVALSGPQNMKGKQQGKMTVDIRSGQVIRGEMTQDLNGDAHMVSKGTIDGFVK
jgi:hypothetical protein